MKHQQNVRSLTQRAIWAALFSALILCLLCAGAAAADIPIKVAMQVSPTTFTGPAEASIQIRVSNASDRDLPGPVTLYYPNGKQIEDFGEPVLAAGSSVTWDGTWDVTQAQLDAGAITFRIHYSMYDDNGEVVSKSNNFRKEITFNGVVATVEVSRVITPTTAGRNQNVSITYDVVNTGNVDIENVNVTDSAASGQRKNLGTIKAGEKGTAVFTVKMGSRNISSKGTVTYEAAGKTYTETKEAAQIKYGELKLTSKLEADKKGGLIGDSVKLTLTLKNTGKEDFEGITVTDATLGELWSGETVRAGESSTLEKTISIDRTIDYQFLISATDTAGSTIETATDRVTVTAIEPSQVLNLTANAKVDHEMVYALPATVHFTVEVTNTSGMDASNVTVTAGENTLYTFPTILAGETRSFTRDAMIDMGGQFQFNVNARNLLGEQQSFASNIVYITFTEPTPVPTEAPIVTPPAPNYERVPTAEDMPEWYDQAGKALNYASIALGALAALCLVLVIAAAISRVLHRRNAVEALDQLDLIDTRDYSQEDGGNSNFESDEDEILASLEENTEESPTADEAEGQSSTGRRARRAAADPEQNA